PAYDRWFAASIGRREVSAAVEISDLAKRRRFYQSQPLAGRLVALRELLASPLDSLGKAERLQRQALLARHPRYREFSTKSDTFQGKLAALDPLVTDGRLSQDADRLLKSWATLSQSQEALLWQMAFSRAFVNLAFPPARPLAETQKSLASGDALLVFHRSGGALHGFLIVNSDQHYWRLPGNLRAVTGEVSKALRELGNYGQSRPLPGEDAASDGWQTTVAQLGKLVLGESRLDLATVKRIIIVPDGPLWHVPFETLLLAADSSAPTLLEAAPVRMAPTVGLAVGAGHSSRPVKRTGLALRRPSGDAIEREVIEEEHRRLTASVDPSVLLASPTPAASPLLATTIEQLIVDHDTQIDTEGYYAWSPTPIDRNTSRGFLTEWLTLPAAAPQRLILARMHTLAETGLKVGRRSTGDPRLAGDELFHAACGLMGAGVQTTLMSRWTTDGVVHGELIREFAEQMDDRPAADAWQRSVALARSAMLDPQLEPRLDWEDDSKDPPAAKHPFFWSGYLLLDTGVDSNPPASQEPEDSNPAAPAAKPADAKPADVQQPAA
ncbi:MAG: CHAT domain-containing protein, partial [Planctomycetota bacterium]